MKFQETSYPRQDQPVGQRSSGCHVTSREHLFSEIKRVDILIQMALKRARLIFGTNDQFRGLYISEDDVNKCIEEPIGKPAWASAVIDAADNTEQFLYEELKSSNAHAAQQSIANGTEIRLTSLKDAFCLSDSDIDTILVCLLVDVDLRYEKIYAYLQDDVTRKYPAVDLILDLLCGSATDRLAFRSRFSADSKLLQYRLIELADDPARIHSSLLGKVVKLPHRLVNFLLEIPSTENQIIPFARIVEADTIYSGPILHPSTQLETGHLARHLKHNRVDNIVYLQGPEGSGREQVALQLALVRQAKVLCVELELLCAYSEDGLSEKLGLVIREALLQDADLYFSGFDSLLANDKQAYMRVLCEKLSIFHKTVVIAGEEPLAANLPFIKKNIFLIELRELSVDQRGELWRHMLQEQCIRFPDSELRHIAERFRFTPKQINEAIAKSKILAATKNPDNIEIEIPHLFKACRLTTNRKLATLAKRIVPRYCWDDIILESDQLSQLRQLYNTVQHRALVYDNWGFGDKLSLGKGVNALFSGPPGTGKTMAAEIIAKNLGLELYKIDLSLVVSKYIGETEKNLARIFKEAETSNAILFFDEADALFGKRTDIKNSHDRFANVEVAYLLQKMEEYDGITILATNLRKNMDEAFVRRLAFIIRFPFPEKSERKNIWQSIWPESTPLAEDIDLEFLSTQFKLAGGNIKNIALAASFLAAEEGGKVGMKHLILSTKREFEKQGRTCVAADFCQYSTLLH